MRDDQRRKNLLEEDVDLYLLCDVLSMSMDGCCANTALYKRVSSGLEQNALQTISSLYMTLSERLSFCLKGLPIDTGTMNPEPGYIAKAYLAATKAPIEKAPNRVMRVNKQALKRMRKLAARLTNKKYAATIDYYLLAIQMSLDTMQYQRHQEKVVPQPYLLKPL